MNITSETNLHLDILIIAEDGSSIQNDVENNAPLILHHHRAHPVSPGLLKAQRNFLKPTKTIVKNGVWPFVRSPVLDPEVNTSPDPHGAIRSGLENIISSRLKSPSLPLTALNRAIDHYKACTNTDVNDFGELKLDLSLLPITPLIELYNIVRESNARELALLPGHLLEVSNPGNENRSSPPSPSNVSEQIESQLHSRLQTIQVRSQSPVLGDPGAIPILTCTRRRPPPNTERKVLYEFKSRDPATLNIIRGDTVQIVKRADKRGLGMYIFYPIRRAL